MSMGIQRLEPTSGEWASIQSNLDSLQPRDSLPTFDELWDYNMNMTLARASGQLKNHPYTQNPDIGQGRSVYTTEGGLLALASLQVVPGDEIWLVRGSRTPVVLRQAKEKEGYLLLGQAYVHGIMHGEAMTGEAEGSFKRIGLV
jgi:hypothetical protein